MNQYGLPLAAGSVDQSILPVMYQSGRIIGYALITSTSFDGTETSYTLTDGLVLPLTTVTLDVDPTQSARVTQYMAAVFSDGLPQGFAPWASEYVLAPDINETPYRMWRLPAQTWALQYVPGNLVVALLSGMDSPTTPPTTPSPPTVSTPETLYWKASVSYLTLLGDCPFFDFNWVTLFSAKTDTQALRIVVSANPAPIAPSTQAPMVAKVVGQPVAVGAGSVRYDTIRIMRMVDALPANDYTFGFNIYDELGQVTPAVLTLTIE